MFIVLDTNILLHYRYFEDIPWSQELNCEDNTIVLSAIVLEEIDKKKDGEKGRIQKRAKQISSKVGEILIEDKTSKLPVLYLESCSATKEEIAFNNLDRNDNHILFDVL